MIPWSSRECVEFKDDDGVVFTFAPKTPALERELSSLYSKPESMEELLNKTGDFLDRILKKCSCTEGMHPQSEIWNLDERVKIFLLWSKANTLPTEEKKS